MNKGPSLGRMPANVLLGRRAIVMAGLANEADAVNLRVALMYMATAIRTAFGRKREEPQMMQTSPNIATIH